jgi:hypothetical protein
MGQLSLLPTLHPKTDLLRYEESCEGLSRGSLLDGKQLGIEVVLLLTDLLRRLRRFCYVFDK